MYAHRGIVEGIIKWNNAYQYFFMWAMSTSRQSQDVLWLFFVQELRFEDCEASSLKYTFVCAKSCFLEVETVSRVSAYVRVVRSNWKRKKHKFLVFPEVPVPVLFMQHLPVLHYFLSKKRNIKSHLVIPTYLNLKVSFNNYWLLTTF